MSQRLLREMIHRILIEQKESCPLPTQDLKLNTENRNKAIKADHIQYGPLNLSDESYWEDIAEHWDTTPDVAKESRCYNCTAFDISPRMAACMPGEIMTEDEIEQAREEGEPWETLGYCWMHDFKCHSARSCYTWAAGGPIDNDNKSESWQDNK